MGGRWLTVCMLMLCQWGAALAPPGGAPKASRRDVLAFSAALGLGMATVKAAPKPAMAGDTAAAAAVPPPVAEVPALSNAEEFWSGLLAGGVSRTAKLVVLHPLDTIKTRVQLQTVTGRTAPLLEDLYDGILPPLVAGTPGSAIFFAVKDLIQNAAKESIPGADARLITTLAVLLANFPYWVLQTPSEAVKTRLQARDKDPQGSPALPRGQAGAGTSLSSNSVVPAGDGTMALRDQVEDLYSGYASNLAYSVPVDVIKFLIYDELKRMARERNGGRPLSTLTSAVFGSVSASTAQALTTPLDVLRTRIMLKGKDSPDQGPTELDLLRQEVDAEGLSVLFAGTPQRMLRGIVGGATQFGVYEATKVVFGDSVARKFKK